MVSAKKIVKVIDTDYESRVDRCEINLAQKLLKEQFIHINGLQSTLLREIGPMTSKKKKNKL